MGSLAVQIFQIFSGTLGLIVDLDPHPLEGVDIDSLAPLRRVRSLSYLTAPPASTIAPVAPCLNTPKEIP